MIDASGYWPKKSIGSNPRPVTTRPKIPFTGFINIFFQTRADTVGITKNGAITIIRIKPLLYIGLSSNIAAVKPPTEVTNNTPPTRKSVLRIASVKLGSVTNQY